MMDKRFEKLQLEKWIKQSMIIFEEELPMLIDELIETPEAPQQIVGKKTKYMRSNKLYDCKFIITQRFME